MATPTRVNDYNYARLSALFAASIQKDYKLPDAQVKVTSGALTDLDNDGAYNDFAGNALLKVDGSFKSFIFLMRKDGSYRLLDNSGYPLDPNKGLATLTCSSKPIACPNTFERAQSQIRGAYFSVFEFDKSQAGLEVVIPRGEGEYSILNSLAVFVKP